MVSRTCVLGWVWDAGGPGPRPVRQVEVQEAGIHTQFNNPQSCGLLTGPAHGLCDRQGSRKQASTSIQFNTPQSHGAVSVH